MSAQTKSRRSLARQRKYRYVDRGFILLLLTVFQLVCAVPVVFEDGNFYWQNALQFAGYILFEWLYVAVMHFAFKKPTGKRLMTLDVTASAPIAFKSEKIENPEMPSPERMAFSFAQPAMEATVSAVFGVGK